VVIRYESSSTSRTPTNAELADRLDEIALLLDSQEAGPYRIQAYRAAARFLRGLDRAVGEILTAEGTPGLVRLPTIGQSIARTLAELSETGSCGILLRLRGDRTSEDVLQTVPGIGPELARRIHEELGVESLVDLEAAAWDGRLARVPGLGARRVRAVRESLAGRLGRPPPRREAYVAEDDPPVSELLDVDREYRQKAAADRLMRIAPRRFNPERKAWLPVLHTRRGDWAFTALYSNTARAHELGRERDWVVIYAEDRAHHERQYTVVTAARGLHAGQRVVRGREAEL
jgi:putative hydrolase